MEKSIKKKLIPKAQLGTLINNPLLDNFLHFPVFKNIGKNFVRRQLYNNISPYGYSGQNTSFNERAIKGLLIPEEKSESPNEYLIYDSQVRKNILGKYLQIPLKRGDLNRIEESPYKPSKSKNTDTKYYRFIHNHAYPIKGPYEYPYKWGTIEEKIFEDSRYDNFGFPKENEVQPSYILSGYLGIHNLSRGRDEKGDYLSYYDKWDLNPLEGESKEIHPSKVSKILYGNIKGDVSMGIGNPVEFYDRLYFDDYYGVKGKDRGSHWLPEVYVFPKNE